MFWLYIFKVLLFFNFINIDKQPYTDTKKHHKKTTALFTPLTSVEAPPAFSYRPEFNSSSSGAAHAGLPAHDFIYANKTTEI
ncbi:hydrogenase [Aggregatibacter actinomycetemcomitans serotype d str. SA2200]|nr:hydrogenase [Aggregatibacter actinomycetemcomitans serotype d str. SA2200]KYK95524.1 hydrogenase [Aggregatibacter actinomycetemcomitans serotype d str. SA3733]